MRPRGVTQALTRRTRTGIYRSRQPGLVSSCGRAKPDVLLDTLLLSQTDFLIGSVSAVSSYAILFSPRLHTRSFIMDVVGQPPPTAAEIDSLVAAMREGLLSPRSDASRPSHSRL